MTIYSANTTNLLATLSKAVSGDTVQLQSGTYPPTTIKVGKWTGDPVILEPAPGAMVEIKGLYCIGVAGLLFRGFNFSRNPASLYLVNVSGCQNIRFIKNKVKGDMNPLDGIKAVGFNLRASQNIEVLENDISEVGQAVAHTNCNQGMKINGNHIHDLRGNTDGIRGNSSNCEVLNNSFTDFYTQGTWHADAIQWWTDMATVPPVNILIQGNIFRRGKGNAIQFIFFGNHPEAGDLPYGTGIVIRDNLGEGTIWWGISVGVAEDPLVENNLIIGFDDTLDANGKLITPRVSVSSSKGGRILNNSAPVFMANNNSPEVTLAGNKVIPVVKAGDTSLGDAWIAAQSGTDPKDAEIQRLMAALAAEELDDAALETRALTAEEALVAERLSHQATKTSLDSTSLLLTEARAALTLIETTARNAIN